MTSSSKRPTSPCYEWHSLNGKGYGQHQARKPTRRTWQVHRVVYEMAHGTQPKTMFVRHLCGNPACVRLDHLACGTPAENAADMRMHGTVMTGERNPRAKLTAKDVQEIRRRRATGEKLTSIAADFGITFQTVHDIAARRRWREVA